MTDANKQLTLRAVFALVVLFILEVLWFFGVKSFGWPTQVAVPVAVAVAVAVTSGFFTISKEDFRAMQVTRRALIFAAGIAVLVVVLASHIVVIQFLPLASTPTATTNTSNSPPTSAVSTTTTTSATSTTATTTVTPPPPTTSLHSGPTAVPSSPVFYKDAAGNLYVEIGGKFYRCDEIKQTYASTASLNAADPSERDLALAALGIADPGISGAPVLPLPSGAQIAAGVPAGSEVLDAHTALDMTVKPRPIG